MSFAHIRPGIVEEIIDNKGTIKASCCGLFSDVDATDKLPPIYPFPLGGANNFSSVHNDDEIWVMFFDDNPLELFYIRKDNFPEQLKEILDKNYEDVEVIASRDMPNGVVQIYFTEGDGWIIQNADSVIQIRKDGSILLDTGYAHRKIDVNYNSISIGSKGTSAHTAAYGDSVVNSLNILNDLLDALSESAHINPYTQQLGATIDTLRPRFEESLEEIESQHVTLD